MIGDVNKADILTSFDELLRNCLPLLWWSSRSPASKIDYRNRWLPSSHDFGSSDWQYLVLVNVPIVVAEDSCGGEVWLCPLCPRQLKIYSSG